MPLKIVIGLVLLLAGAVVMISLASDQTGNFVEFGNQSIGGLV